MIKIAYLTNVVIIINLVLSTFSGFVSVLHRLFLSVGGSKRVTTFQILTDQRFWYFQDLQMSPRRLKVEHKNIPRPGVCFQLTAKRRLGEITLEKFFLCLENFDIIYF
jgi:hypothetical protein